METRLICWSGVFWIWTSLANFGNFCSNLGRYVLGKSELKAQGSAAAAKVVHCTIKTQLFTTSSSSSDQSYCWNAKCITQLLDFTSIQYFFRIFESATDLLGELGFENIQTGPILPIMRTQHNFWCSLKDIYSYLKGCWLFSVVMFNKPSIIGGSHWFRFTAL